MEPIKRKVRSLLCVAAPGSGATDPERATARAIADRIMAANGLREADIPERQVALPRPTPPAQPVFRFVFVQDFNSTTGTSTGTSWTFGGFR